MKQMHLDLVYAQLKNERDNDSGGGNPNTLKQSQSSLVCSAKAAGGRTPSDNFESANVNNTFTNIFIVNAWSIRIKEQQQGNRRRTARNIFHLPYQMHCTHFSFFPHPYLVPQEAHHAYRLVDRRLMSQDCISGLLQP